MIEIGEKENDKKIIKEDGKESQKISISGMIEIEKGIKHKKQDKNNRGVETNQLKGLQVEVIDREREKNQEDFRIHKISIKTENRTNSIFLTLLDRFPKREKKNRPDQIQ